MIAPDPDIISADAPVTTESIEAIEDHRERGLMCSGRLHAISDNHYQAIISQHIGGKIYSFAIETQRLDDLIGVLSRLSNYAHAHNIATRPEYQQVREP
jgi:hypothetical protein